MDIMSFYPLIRDFFIKFTKKQSWKEKAIVINYSDFPKTSICQDLEKQGYILGKDITFSLPSDIALNQDKGLEIYYKENKKEHIRSRVVTEGSRLTLMIKPKQ